MVVLAVVFCMELRASGDVEVKSNRAHAAMQGIGLDCPLPARSPRLLHRRAIWTMMPESIRPEETTRAAPRRWHIMKAGPD